MLWTDCSGDVQWGLVDYHRAFVWEGGWGREYPGEPYGLAYNWCACILHITYPRHKWGAFSAGQDGHKFRSWVWFVAACTHEHSQ